jgi:hypothetical protein
MQTQQHEDKTYVIVTDADADKAGAQTYWSLAGEVNREEMFLAMTKHGLDHEPRLVEPETALGRALSCLKGRRRFLRNIRKGRWAVVEEGIDVTRDTLKHWEGPIVSLDKVGRPVLENATMEEAKAVREAYARALDILDTNDISHWLLTAVSRLTGVGLRKGGGIYYVPPSRMPEWRKHIEVLAECAPDCSVYTIPMIKMTADGARAILDSLTGETIDEADALTAEVLDGSLGVRGLDNRAASSRALLAKVSEYEHLLGTRVDRLRDVIAKLDVDIVAAKLAAEAAAEEGS